MDTRKLGKPTDQRLAMLSNLATDILWFGHIETTFDRAKAAAKIVEKIITLAVNSYEDVVAVEKTTLDSNGKEKKVTVSKDGVKKLNARNDYNNRITLLNCKIDSINNSLKYEVKSKKDTIIIDVKPQIIKIKQPCYIDR